jgi:hypothetical protein
MGGTRELRKIFFEKIPIMKITNELNEAFKCRIAEFAETKNEVLKEEINLEIFNLYNLSQDEINFINLSI